MGKFGDCKHTTAFHKLSKTIRQQILKTHCIVQMLYKVVGNWQQRPKMNGRDILTALVLSGIELNI